MRGKGVSGDFSQSRGRALKGCTFKGNLDNVVLIDVENDVFDNVIIIDVPEGKRFPFRHIISIDDDESNTVDCPGICVEGGVDLHGDDTSNNSSPTTDHTQNSVDADGDECWVVHGNKSKIKLSKCNRTYSGRNRYGLNSDSESDSSDCELMEGSSGKLREEWEKASQKRKCKVHNVQSGLDDRAGASSSYSANQPNDETENRTEQHPDVSVGSPSWKKNFEKENFSAFIPSDGCFDGSSLNLGVGGPFVESNRKVEQKNFSWWKPGTTDRTDSHRKAYVQFRGETSTVDPNRTYAKPQSYEHANGFGASFEDEGRNSQACSSWSKQGVRDEQYDNKKDSGHDQGASSRKYENLGETHYVYNEGLVYREKDEEPSRVSCIRNNTNEQCRSTDFEEKEKLVSGEQLELNAQKPEDVVAPSECRAGVVPEELFISRRPSFSISEVCSEKGGIQDGHKPDYGEILRDTQLNDNQINLAKSNLAETNGPFINSISAAQPCSERDSLNAQDDDDVPAVQPDIINEREKLKETDEYKRAVEEEWASRQQQLQIQAEEAQRLRKKKKAESLRLLDMERRLKQRVEEVRESQKKDKENMDLKEQLRIEVRKELYKLEVTCIDMASLLRGLGIHVGGGFFPLSDEVHAAYKQALRRFHPDRASRADIRQQVEAEEKFKLVSRMKEKFLSTSCH